MPNLFIRKCMALILMHLYLKPGFYTFFEKTNFLPVIQIGIHLTLLMPKSKRIVRIKRGFSLLHIAEPSR